MYRILVTGSRTWTDEGELQFQLDWVLQIAREAGHQEVVLVDGMAEEGADWMAFKWARHIVGVPVEEHPADWRKFRTAAGVIRNEEMVKAGADVCVAFLMPCLLKRCKIKKPHWTHGTDHCVREAEKAEIPVIRVYG